MATAGRIGAGAWLAVVLSWLLDISGHGLPHVVAQAVAVVAFAALAAVVVGAIRRIWTGKLAAGTGGRWLLFLVALSFAVHFIGLGHEITGRYFGDEGIYLARAQEINDGALFEPWFIYPHLLFYLDALALWVAGLFGPLVPAMARLLYGVAGKTAVAALVTRSVTSGLAALTVVPVAVIARRLTGSSSAAIVGGALAVLSPLFVEVGHLNISDVSSAFFATLTLMQVTRLLDRETTSDYLLAGVWAGLAAGSKYPAGVVAVAIVAIWVRWCWRTRRLSFALLWAGLASIAAFVVTTPSFLVHPEAVFGGGPDILFGYRQYARGGWAGVLRTSNSAYYLGHLSRSFGVPTLVLGLTGLAVAGRRTLVRLAWLLPFPAFFLWTMLSMKISVKRNILPALPMLAAILGIGIAAWAIFLARRRGHRGRLWGAALAAGCLALPLLGTAEQVVRLARPTTRDVARTWVESHLPRGSFLVQEDYTPRMSPPHHFPARKPRFIIRLTPEELRDPKYDFLFLASASYGRFFRPEGHAGRPLEGRAGRYQEIFDGFELVREFTPGRWQNGPVLRLYKVDPDPVRFGRQERFDAAEGRTRTPSMRPEGAAAIRYLSDDEWGLFKAYLMQGRYEIEVAVSECRVSGSVRVVNRENELLDEGIIDGDGRTEVLLERAEKVFLYIYLPPGCRLDGVTVDPLEIELQPIPAPVSSLDESAAPAAAEATGTLRP